VGTHPQIEDALLTPPYGNAGGPAGAYLGAADGDALINCIHEIVKINTVD
jgi:hypothetical protein